MGPIGVFDSGYGGLTVLQALTERLPQHDFLYIGDNARSPYGTRSFDTIYKYTLQAVHEFFRQGCHLVILACNTASAKALRTIQQNDLPNMAPHKRVLGIIRPSAEAILNYTQNKNIGLFATPGTVASESYFMELHKIDPTLHLTQEACPIWVPLVENHEVNNPGTHYFVKQHVNQLLAQSTQIDTILLACTHYPLLRPIIEHYVPKHIQILSQGEIVAHSLTNYLQRHPEIKNQCSQNSQMQYFTTETVENFQNRAKYFYNRTITAKQIEL